MIFLFKYLPRSLGVPLQNYLQQVLPAIIDGLADENESVRDAAHAAGHVLVEYFATTSLPLLLPAVEEGIFSDNWRIRQSSGALLGDLLFKVAGTSGKAHLEGGSDDEGSSTEAHGRAIIEHNEVLAALYMVHTDVSIIVRQYFEDEEVLDLLSLVPGAQGMEQYLQSLQCLKDEKRSPIEATVKPVEKNQRSNRWSSFATETKRKPKVLPLLWLERTRGSQISLLLLQGDGLMEDMINTSSKTPKQYI
nr:eIF-2-alpha kinase activator GCN1 isoform X21 [Ipomoea batatas]